MFWSNLQVGLLGKSASRHLDRLKQQLVRQAELLSELAGKPGSVLFSAYRDEGDSGGECYLTFSGTNSNIGKMQIKFDLYVQY